MNLNRKLFSITDKGKDYEKCKEFIYSPWKSGIKSRTVFMRIAGWTMLLEEALSACIEQELGLKCLDNRIWANDYNNHYRKVFGLFLVNESCATFKWGLNFDFNLDNFNKSVRKKFNVHQKLFEYVLPDIKSFYEACRKAFVSLQRICRVFDTSNIGAYIRELFFSFVFEGRYSTCFISKGCGVEGVYSKEGLDGRGISSGKQMV